MKNHFAILPWEHPGASFDPAPHAQTRMEIGGRERRFWLKMRDGVIFFKEPLRASVYAVLETFDSGLSRDPDELVAKWREEVKCDNFGSFSFERHYFPGVAVRGCVLCIVRSDGSGWTKEHFDQQWFSIPMTSEVKPFSLWNWKEAERAIVALRRTVQTLLLDRAIAPSVRALEPPRFVGTDANNAELLFRALNCLQLQSGYGRSIVFNSYSAFAEGDIGHGLSPAALFKAPAHRIFALITERNTFVGVRWSQGREEHQYRPHTESKRAIKAGLEKWGHNWRGNWAPQGAQWELEFPVEISAHERLEAALLLREWIQDKFTQAEREELLAQIAV